MERETAFRRHKAWRDRVVQNLSQQPGKIFAWCRGGYQPAPVGTVREGKTHVDPTEVAQAVEAHWEQWWLQEPLGSTTDMEAL